jgi:hypothetical protein
MLRMAPDETRACVVNTDAAPATLVLVAIASGLFSTAVAVSVAAIPCPAKAARLKAARVLLNIGCFLLFIS